MANRSYLYTTDHLPDSQEWEKSRDLRGIAEWNYDIPLVFKLLLSGNPQAVSSSIWETPEKIALAGEFKSGLQTLEIYLDKLPDEAAPLVEEARDFLLQVANQRNYFILECGEIFAMEEGSLEEKNLLLLKEIRALKDNVLTLKVPEALVVKSSEPDHLEPFYSIGLGNWSNILYFHFEEECI